MTKKALLLNFILISAGIVSNASADSVLVQRPSIENSCESIAITVYDACIFNACNGLAQCRNYEECSDAILFCMSESPKCEDQKAEDLKKCMPEVDNAPRPKPVPDPMFP